MRLRFVVILILGSSPLAGQQRIAPHWPFVRYTTDDGLPSSEVYEVIQDRQGYLWFGTDNGVSRFNGHTFENFGALEGLADPVILGLQEDRHGRIWMLSLTGRIYYYEKQRVHAFEGNRVLDSLGVHSWSVSGFYVDSSGAVYAALQEFGLLRFTRDGGYARVLHDGYRLWLYAVENHALGVLCYDYARLPEYAAERARWHRTGRRPLSFFQHGRTATFDLPFANVGPQYVAGTALRDGSLLVSTAGSVSCYRAGRIEFSVPHPFVNSWLETRSRQIFTGLSEGHGVRRYADLAALQAGRFETMFDRYTVSHVLEDRDGGLWFATIEAGVFYCANQQVSVYDRSAGLPSELVTGIALKDRHHWYIGLLDHGVLELHSPANRVYDLQSPSREIRDLVYDRRNDVLWASTPLQYHRDGRWTTRSVHGPDAEIIYGARHLRWFPAREQLWGIMSFYFWQLRPDLDTCVFHSNYDYAADRIYRLRTLDVHCAADGRVWVANINGLFELASDRRLVPPPALHPAFTTRVEAVDELPDGTLVIGSKGYGLLFWKGDRFAMLTQADGLTANMIENLHVDAAGDVWAGTLNGLNRVRWRWDRPSATTVQVITTAHGLPNNEVTRVCTHHGQVWVGTNAGLAYFKGLPTAGAARAPLLESLWVNDSLYALPASGSALSLSSDERSLRLAFASLQYNRGGRIAYRYRLHPDAAWTYTTERRLDFAQLTDGAYRFEIQADNADGSWSDSTVLEFSIEPYWWATAWFRAAVMAACLAAGAGFYRRRLRRLRRETTQRQQVADLERSALQAQMNPHFIFNCLNSIQQFIFQNEKEAAVEYLGSFARLIRIMLHASVEGRISVEDELELLRDYLELEQLRFGHRFTYEVGAEPGLDTFEAQLPPLLIQPYVENAVLHGMAGRQTGGHVAVWFAERDGRLEVTIRDNGSATEDELSAGPAAAVATTATTKTHKSVGMMITGRRLELLSTGRNTDALHIENRRDEAGASLGTVVTIRLDFLSEPLQPRDHP
jgi:ligand-binding sensor domain-containing protein/anti-sigma regulatory factor (Ser/Thr protein kinase)